MPDGSLILKQETLPEGYFRVVALVEPFREGARVEATFQQGLTLEQLLRRILPRPEYIEFAHVRIEDSEIYPALYHAVKPKAGATIYVRVYSGAAGAVALISAVAGSYVASSAAIIAALGTTGAAIAGAVVATAVSFVAGAVLGIGEVQARSPITNRLGNQENESPTYGITNARNQERPYSPIPVVLGTHKFVPSYGATPYTEIVGNLQYLRFSVIWGYGPVSVSDVKIGNTPIDQYSEVTIENDFAGTNALSLYPKDVSQEGLSLVLTESYQTIRTDGEVNDFGVTFSFPQGLGTIVSTTGTRTRLSVTITAQYRKVGDASWTDWFSEEITDNTREVKRVSYRASFLGASQAKDYSGETITTDATNSPNLAQLYDGTIYGTALTFSGMAEGDEIVKIVFASAFDLGSVFLQNVQGNNKSIQIQTSTDGGSNWSDYSEAFSVGFGSDQKINLVAENVDAIRLVVDSDYSLIQLQELTIFEYSGENVQIDPAEYDIRVLRSAESTDVNARDEVVWTALRSFNNENPIQLNGLAKSAYRIKGTDQLNGIVDQLNGVVSGLIPTWNGSAFTGAAKTSNPADIFRFVLSGAPNKEAVDGSQLDDANLGEWHEFCETEGLTYNAIIDYRVSVRDLLIEIAAAGRATPRLIDDAWGVIIDQPRSTITQHFTPRNSRNFTAQIRYSEIPEGVKVRFFNEEKGYREDERTVYDDGFSESNANKFQVLELPGVTDPDNVYKLARIYIASERLRPEIFTFETDVEYLVAQRGDLIRLNHDVPQIGTSFGRVKSVDGNDVTLDELVTMESGKSYAIRFRRSNGDTNLQSVTLDVGSTKEITVDDGTNVAAGDLFQFGETDEESLTLILSEIQPLDELGARLICVPYDEAVYDADETIPAYTSVLSDPVSLSFVGPPKPVITEVISDEDALQRNADGSISPAILLYFRPGTSASPSDGTVTQTTGYRIRFRRSGSTDSYRYLTISDADTAYATLQPVTTGDGYDVEIQAVGPGGEVSDYSKVVDHIVLGATAKPDPVDSFTLNTVGDSTYVQWDYTAPIDLSHYEIRYHPDQDITTWAAMSMIADRVPKDARSFEVPSRSGSYAIKPVDVLGNYAATALYINATLEDLFRVNVIETEQDDPDFDGTKTDVVVVGSALQLADITVMADWTTLADVTTLSYGVDQGFEQEGFYEFENDIDLGAVYTSRVTANLDGGVISALNFMATWDTLAEVDALSGDATGDETEFQLQVKYSANDVAAGSATFSDWIPFAVGDYTARHYKFRIRMTSTVRALSPFVDRARVSVDMPDRVVDGDDIASGAGTKSVAFSPAFYVFRSVGIAAQNLQQGDYYEIANKSRTGFDITFRDSGGSAVDRTFDYVAVGYGYERGT